MAARPGRSWLADGAARLAEVTSSWVELTGEVPAERSYRRLAASDRLEAWLICWPLDGHLQLHDHGGADGAFHVVDGMLDERGIDERGDDLGCVAGLRRRLIRAGEGVSFDGSYIHDVRNTEPAAATSVHLYTQAVRPMAFYRLDERGAVRMTARAAGSAVRDEPGDDADATSASGSTARRPPSAGRAAVPGRGVVPG